MNDVCNVIALLIGVGRQVSYLPGIILFLRRDADKESDGDHDRWRLAYVS